MAHYGSHSEQGKEKNDQNNGTRSEPPGAPDRTPVKEPDEKKKPLGDPRPPSKRKTRM